MAFEQGLRLLHALLLEGVAIIHLYETHGLAHVQAPSERRVWFFLVLAQPEWRRVAGCRCGREEHMREPRSHTAARKPRAQARELVERLTEWLGQMDFI